MKPESLHDRPYWNYPVEELIVLLVSSAHGLDSGSARERLEQFGHNQLKERKKNAPLVLFLNQFRSSLVLILIFAAVISIITSEWIDAAIVMVIVIASAFLGFIQEYNASNAVEKLRSRVCLKNTVLRDDIQQTILSEDVVPGDVVVLSAGSIIPADGVIIQSNDFFVNQAVLTGETFPVEKKYGQVAVNSSLSERTNCVLMGTNVRSGSALALICETGSQSAFGQIAEKLTLRPPETDFERGIRRFGNVLTQVMMALVLVVFAVNVILNKPPVDSLLFAVALAVGMAPELLPAIISITLSKGAQKMARSGVIVRRLESIENFGSMDVLCTDKTGTLTMGVVSLDGALDWQGNASEQVLRYAYLNAKFQSGLANPLDEAILRELPAGTENFIKTEEIPYDFIRKRLSIAVQDATSSYNKYTLLTKGALDNILNICTQIEMEGMNASLDETRRAALQQKFAEWSDQGFRVLGVAVKQMEPQAEYSVDVESGMTFAGFLLFFDPPKLDASQAVADLTRLGVTLKVITGDNRRVALHVAQNTGLQITGILTGAEMNQLHDEALWHQAEKVNLFAEVDPNQKERIISALRKTGHVVGYMGDGINDAPALHAADVSISVDTAVDVAKESADFVLLEQSLSVLRQGIQEGRQTFANTLKYIYTTTSANFGNMFSMAGLSMFLPFLPLLAKQILLNNFLSDFPAMTIAADTVDPEMVEKPRRWNVTAIRNFMVLFGLISSVFDYLTFGVLLLVLNASEDQFRTGWFIESLLTELFILLVVRTSRPLFKSKPGFALWLSTLMVCIVALTLPYLPGIGSLFNFVPLPPVVMGVLLLILFFYIAANEFAKRVFFRRDTF